MLPRKILPCRSVRYENKINSKKNLAEYIHFYNFIAFPVKSLNCRKFQVIKYSDYEIDETEERSMAKGLNTYYLLLTTDYYQ